jgi:hypothetical protein
LYAYHHPHRVVGPALVGILGATVRAKRSGGRFEQGGTRPFRTGHRFGPYGGGRIDRDLQDAKRKAEELRAECSSETVTTSRKAKD